MIQIMIQWAKDPKWSQSQIVMGAFDRVRQGSMYFSQTGAQPWKSGLLYTFFILVS